MKSDKKLDNEVPRGEVVLIEKKGNEPLSPEAFKALMDFQYEDAEPSEEGFRRLTEISKKK